VLRLISLAPWNACEGTDETTTRRNSHACHSSTGVAGGSGNHPIRRAFDSPGGTATAPCQHSSTAAGRRTGYASGAAGLVQRRITTDLAPCQHSSTAGHRRTGRARSAAGLIRWSTPADRAAGRHSSTAGHRRTGLTLSAPGVVPWSTAADRAAGRHSAAATGRRTGCARGAASITIEMNDS